MCVISVLIHVMYKTKQIQHKQKQKKNRDTIYYSLYKEVIVLFDNKKPKYICGSLFEDADNP